MEAIMSWITNSKVFAGSSNKEAILAASKSPINQELMRQVASYLSEDTIEELQSMEPEVEVEDVDVGVEEGRDEARSSDVAAPGPSHVSHSAPSGDSGSLTEEMGDLSDAGVPDAMDDVDVTEVKEETTDAPTEEVESAESISIYDYNDLVDKLNSDESTAGVRRISDNNNEIWIYYSDDINLNNIMDPVIECVSKCCPDADFNRLARSKNAIVFLTNG